MTDKYDHLTDGLCLAVREAGAKIMEIYESDFEVRSKGDESPVTAADEAAEVIILDHLARLAPEIPVVAEESVSAGNIPDISGGTYWLVDPLDGTREFVNRNGEFTVNIGLIEDRHPVLGVVYAPVPDRLFFGNVASGAFCENIPGQRETIQVRAPDADGLVVVASRSHRDAATDDYLEQFTVKDLRSAGSSLKFCLVAAGEADFYPRLGPTMEWDTAAAHGVLNAAGGSLTTLDDEDFLYGKADFRNGFFVARGNFSA
jgi:3'(2'), 5'-bisphosphate nucleotidase